MRSAALCLALAGATAAAAPLRLAVVYGHNGGHGARPPLRYAEADAARVAATLQDAGGFARDDLQLLTGRPVAELLAALDWARTRAGERKESLLVVYVSAHGDAKAGLLPGDEALPWAALKARVAATGLKARVTIVDACQSSGLLEVSGRATPEFTLTAEEDALPIKGDVFITSSAADEPSLEAGAMEGSVFTRHLVAGLRGAADASGDRLVTLEEAYRYAFERTTEGQSGQHPGYGARLVGYGAVPLARFAPRRSGLTVPAGLEQLTVRAAGTRRLLVSARRPQGGFLAVPPGRWEVEVLDEGQARSGRVEVGPTEVALEVAALSPAPSAPVALVRLSAGARCAEVAVPRPDPLLLALRDELLAALGGPCARPGEGLGVTLDREAGLLRAQARLPGAAGDVVRRAAPAQRGELVRALAELAQGP